MSFNRVIKPVDAHYLSVDITDDKQQKSSWLVTRPRSGDRGSVAFKTDKGHIIPAEIQESVVHSFMPTNTKISIPIKINGDFSTDPSRTIIILD